MANKKKLKKPAFKESFRFKAPKEPPIDFDSLPPAFSFRHIKYSGKRCLSKCDDNAKVSIVDKLMRLSQLTWKQIYSQSKEKLGFEKIPRDKLKFPLPSIVTPEVNIMVFRYSDAGRIAGFRAFDVYHIIAIGPNHDLY